MRKTAIIYSTTDGQTKKICQRLMEQIESQTVVELYSIEEIGRNIEHQMGELTYVTEQSNQQLENQLQSINSSIEIALI